MLTCKIIQSIRKIHRCKRCNNIIKIGMIVNTNNFAVSCGSIECMNYKICESKELAMKYVNEISK